MVYFPEAEFNSIHSIIEAINHLKKLCGGVKKDLF